MQRQAEKLIQKIHIFLIAEYPGGNKFAVCRAVGINCFISEIIYQCGKKTFFFCFIYFMAQTVCAVNRCACLLKKSKYGAFAAAEPAGDSEYHELNRCKIVKIGCE